MNTNYTYDSLSRLLTILHQNGATTIDGATYTYDNAGNRLTKLDHLNAVTQTYGYDNIYQLLTVAQGATTTESYTYDKVGNRLSSLGGITYTVNNSNQLSSISGTPGTTFTYDNNGNTVTKVDANGTTTYTWNSENQLAQVSLPGGATVTFKYDPFGRRAQKVSASGTINYLSDGNDAIGEVGSTGSLIASYTHGAGIDEPLTMLRSGAASFYHADGLGSITSVTNNVGGITNTYSYDAFGKLVVSSATVANPFRYTAREFDPEIGLYYYRARYYEQILGRFTTEDPKRFQAGVNFYTYVRNRSTNFTDPFGLFDLPSCGPFTFLRCIFKLPICAWSGTHCEERSREHFDFSDPNQMAQLCEQTGMSTPSMAVVKICFFDNPKCKGLLETCGKCGLYPRPILTPAAQPVNIPPNYP